MTGKVVFIVAQPGSAGYLCPLWNRWQTAGREQDYAIFLHPAAGTAINKQISNLNISPWPEKTLPDDLGHVDLWVVSATYHPIERQAIERARRTNARVIQILDTAYDQHARIVKTNQKAGMPDKIVVVDELAADGLVSAGIERERIVVVGHPGWEKTERLPGAPKSHVLFVSQPISDDFGQALGFDETSALSMVRSVRDRRPDLIERLYVARHPREKEKTESLEGYELIAAEAGVQVAGTVLGMFSSVMVEAALSGRRVISLQPHAMPESENRDFVSGRGWGVRVADADGLLEALLSVSSLPDMGHPFQGSCERLSALVDQERNAR